ncbi:hypothetical protein GLOTRDRAFT_141540 [Gloeophyllum trabeum ATCC 11539]|uniref:Uncharacterized protein n=1 Tax=Gloeophyllum trabeum (strain ATCC 11539 / FP-39264 / Madison 617) TaxID=670483 RepID=S7PR79_GLOTA|nr:uncharacterized protein GLOTRDRAFT_141540 [Gloeophyllum trabeum ATCC 11539]EPQ50351.1 hypothetical protein GLOTRDRAFT_141540 [Gloeophyllum trabeum ATCC 11539]
MSLPTAPKDISDHPAKGSVVDPVNKQQKDADVDRKLRLYGVIEAFRQGRLPDNQQIDRTLKYVLDHEPVDTSALSPEGKRLIQDTRDIIETARVIVQDKNADELFQNFVWHTRDVNADQVKKDPNEVLPVDQEKARNDSKQAVQHLRTLLSLVLTNSEVRKLLSDFSVIGRDLLAKGAAKAASKIGPDEERLRQVDDTAPNDQFVTEGGRTVGPDETPVLEAKVPGMDATIKQHPRDEPGSGTKVLVNGEEKTGDQAAREGRERMEELRRQGKGQAERQADEIQKEVNDTPSDTEEAKEKKQGLVDRMRGMRDGLVDRIPQQHKDRANEQVERGKTFLRDEYFPEERRDQFIFRGKKVIIECQKHNDYQESVRWLLSFVEEYAKHGKTAHENVKDHGQQVAGDGSIKTATSELRTLLERFANNQSMDSIIDAVNALIEDARNDQELREWFQRVDTYVRKVLLEPGFVIEPQCNREGNEVKDSGRRFYDDKYKGHFDNLFNTISGWFRAMGDDPLNKRFGNDWARLTRDLLFDSEGSLKYKPELWNDVRKVILPTLVDQVGYIPIPRIEYTDKELDLVIENLTLSGRNVFPNYVTLEAHNHMKFSPYNAIADEMHHEFTLTLGQIQADMRDVAFYFRKKTGIPKLTDSGLADVLLGGSGLTATIHLVGSNKDRSSVFKVKDVNVKVDTLKFSIRDSKHDMLYKTLRPLATGLVKKQIQKALEGALKTGLEYVDGQLVSVRDRYQDAKASDEKSRTQALQELFQSKQEEAKDKASKAESKKEERGSQFKVVSKRDSVLIPEGGHPAGWVNRTQERSEAAVSGKDWRSDAFNIV